MRRSSGVRARSRTNCRAAPGPSNRLICASGGVRSWRAPSSARPTRVWSHPIDWGSGETDPRITTSDPPRRTRHMAGPGARPTTSSSATSAEPSSSVDAAPAAWGAGGAGAGGPAPAAPAEAIRQAVRRAGRARRMEGSGVRRENGARGAAAPRRLGAARRPAVRGAS